MSARSTTCNIQDEDRVLGVVLTRNDECCETVGANAWKRAATSVAIGGDGAGD